MQLATTTAPPAPALAVAERYADHFKAAGVDEVVVAAPDQLQLNFTGGTPTDGLQHLLASTGLRDAVNGVKLVFALEDNTPVPRLMPNSMTLKPLYEAMPGVTQVRLASDTEPTTGRIPLVAIDTNGAESAALLSALLVDRLPSGERVVVAPGEG